MIYLLPAPLTMVVSFLYAVHTKDIQNTPAPLQGDKAGDVFDGTLLPNTIVNSEFAILHSGRCHRR